MSIIDKKKKVFGNIAAYKTLTETMPKLKLNSSFPSINNKGNVITFLSDLIKTVIGYAVLIDTIVDILTHSLKKIEKEIKKALKTELKSIVSCGVNPSLPSFIKSTGNGIVIEVKKIDFFGIFKIDANSKIGGLIYNDVTTPLTDSKDFNTFLFGVIQNDGTTYSWKDSNGNKIFDVTFNSVGVGGNPNNSLIIKANSSYDSKSLNDLNNNFIDSLTLFNTENIVNKIIEIVFGSISFKLSRSKKDLEQEEKINKIIDKMIDEDINAKEDDSDSDGFYSFSNEEISIIEHRSNERQRGIVKLRTSEEFDSSVPVESLTSFTETMSSVSTTQEKKSVLSNSLDSMANKSSSNIKSDNDRISVKLDFIQSLITNLLKAIIGIVLSPKVIFIFLINYKIIYGNSSSYVDGIDFIKKNKTLIRQIIKKIAGMIIQILLAIVLKKITKLIGDAIMKKNIEKVKNKQAQLLSLVGVSQEVLRKIKGLG